MNKYKVKYIYDTRYCYTFINAESEYESYINVQKHLKELGWDMSKRFVGLSSTFIEKVIEKNNFYSFPPGFDKIFNNFK